ncbi:MAG: chloride channel protein [Myxococcales bacterium]|nr:chloride channel protein [Myxococcales bacterium]
MARKRFDELDAEQRALHESWDDVARVVLLVTLISGVIWALCTALKKAVHAVGDGLLAWVASASAFNGSAALVLALVVGGLLRGVLNRFESFRNVTGDGIDAALRNYHSTYADPADDPQPRYSLPAFGLAARKILATCLTLGSGASGGLEGPVVLIGESTAAGMARMMAARSEHELRTYQIAGIAAAVATLLNAPFASALFAIEIAYGDRVIYRKIAYALLAGIVAYALNNRVLGYTPVFVAPEHSHTYSLTEYGVTALVAVAVSAPVALAFGLTMKQVRRLVRQAHPVLRGAVGALLTAVVVLALRFGAGMDARHVLGMGDWTLRALLSASPPSELGTWWFLVLAVVGRMLTTGLTVQSGGSAGLLIPSMFLGGVAGAATCRALQLVPPLADLDVSLFVVVGVASALVAMVGVPLAAIALVLEVFGAPYGPPAILACGVTYVLTLRLSVYETQRMSPTPVGDETGG